MVVAIRLYGCDEISFVILDHFIVDIEWFAWFQILEV